MGYGLIEINGSKINVLQYGVLQLKSYPNHAVKLKKIFDATLRLITEYLPDEMAIEAPFFGTNVQSMLKLGRAQGVAMLPPFPETFPTWNTRPKRLNSP